MPFLRKARLDSRVKPYLWASIAFYILALLLPAYAGMPFSDRPLFGWECFEVGWQALFGDPIWVIWTANVTLFASWVTMIFWRKWSLVPAASTVVLSTAL